MVREEQTGTTIILMKQYIKQVKQNVLLTAVLGKPRATVLQGQGTERSKAVSNLPFPRP